MFKKLTLFLVSLAFIGGLAALNTQNDTAYARGAATMAPTDDSGGFDAFIQVSGTIQSVQVQSPSVSIVTLDDGTTILVNPATLTNVILAPGQPITLWGVATDDGNPDFVAKTITLGTATPTEEATEAETPEPTEEATASGTPPATMPPTASATALATQSGTQSATCGSGNTQPVAARLATAFNVSYSVIMGWHCQGFGFGEIAKAYLLSKSKGSTLTNVADIFAMKKGGQGWGNIIRGSGVNPNELTLGSQMHGKASGTGTPTGKGNGKGKATPGGGKGNGKH